MIRHGYVPTLVIVCSCMGIALEWVLLRHEYCSGMGIALVRMLLRPGYALARVLLRSRYALAWVCSDTNWIHDKKRIYGCDSLHTTRETIKIKLLNFFENFWGPKLKIWFIEILPIVERNILTKFGEDPLKTVGGVSSRSAKTLKN